MANSKTTTQKQVSIPVPFEALAEIIWHLRPREREVLEELLEKKLVSKVIRRSREIPRLKKEEKLLSLSALRQSFRQ